MNDPVKEMSSQRFVFRPQYRRVAAVLLFLGAFALASGFAWAPERTWVALLLNSFYFVTLALSGVVFLAIHFAANARWSEALRRIAESFSAYLPIGALTMLVTLGGGSTLYHWSHAEAVAHDPLLQGKAAYLHLPFFIFRMVAILLLWIWFGARFRRASRREDQDQRGDGAWRQRNVRRSVLFLFAFGLSFSLASIDWLMSIEPHWFSTIFGVYQFSGLFLTVWAALAVASITLSDLGLFRQLHDDHLHDLGKMLFGFAFFWGYIWYCQFMLIWYGNIPEETVYYVERLKDDWSWLFYLNLTLNFVIPFVLLMSRSAKRSEAVLFRVALVVLIGRWLDLYLMIAPPVLGPKANIGLLEIGVTAGFVGLFLYVVASWLAREPLFPQRSSAMSYSLHYHS